MMNHMKNNMKFGDTKCHHCYEYYKTCYKLKCCGSYYRDLCNKCYVKELKSRKEKMNNKKYVCIKCKKSVNTVYKVRINDEGKMKEICKRCFNIVEVGRH